MSLWPRWWRYQRMMTWRHITHLEREIVFWRSQFQHERDRAEVAIDQCRSMHQSLPPVTRPPLELGQEITPEATPDWLAAELAAIGQIDGVQR